STTRTSYWAAPNVCRTRPSSAQRRRAARLRVQMMAAISARRGAGIFTLRVRLDDEEGFVFRQVRPFAQIVGRLAVCGRMVVVDDWFSHRMIDRQTIDDSHSQAGSLQLAGPCEVVTPTHRRLLVEWQQELRCIGSETDQRPNLHKSRAPRGEA